jgi:hypothetical protein
VFDDLNVRDLQKIQVKEGVRNNKRLLVSEGFDA